jgi:hypothetical protein
MSNNSVTNSSKPEIKKLSSDSTYASASNKNTTNLSKIEVNNFPLNVNKSSGISVNIRRNSLKTEIFKLSTLVNSFVGAKNKNQNIKMNAIKIPLFNTPPSSLHDKSTATANVKNLVNPNIIKISLNSNLSSVTLNNEVNSNKAEVNKTSSNNKAPPVKNKINLEPGIKKLSSNDIFSSVFTKNAEISPLLTNYNIFDSMEDDDELENPSILKKKSKIKNQLSDYNVQFINP